MDYTRYSRAVIVLEEKNREFAARPGEEIKGYLRVETGNGRGAFRCVMQNVKFYPRGEYTYQLILFGTYRERTIHTVVGTIPVSRYGTGEVYLRFRPQDVDGRGNDYGRYTTAIIAAVSSVNKSEPLHPVLMGKTGHEAEATRAKVTAMSEETADAEEGIAGTGEGTPAAAEMAAVETVAAEAQPSPKRKTYNHFYGEYLKQICGYFCSVPGYYKEVVPFGEMMPEVRWLKIDNSGSMFLVSPGARHFSARYGHFLLGRETAQSGGDRDAVTYYVAVPGRFRAEEQPDGGDSGFRYWLPLGEAGRDEESYGYWILAIDGQSGEIFSLNRS